MNDIKELLQKSKLKATPQRVAILKSIEKLGHASIEEIYEDIKENFPSISLATIYKNIIFTIFI
jgi:Fur family peroxide stress response transcriptional regulator